MEALSSAGQVVFHFQGVYPTSGSYAPSVLASDSLLPGIVLVPFLYHFLPRRPAAVGIHAVCAAVMIGGVCAGREEGRSGTTAVADEIYVRQRVERWKTFGLKVGSFVGSNPVVIKRSLLGEAGRSGVVRASARGVLPGGSPLPAPGPARLCGGSLQGAGAASGRTGGAIEVGRAQGWRPLS